VAATADALYVVNGDNDLVCRFDLSTARLAAVQRLSPAGPLTDLRESVWPVRSCHRMASGFT
jgi:hypothetical protein